MTDIRTKTNTSQTALSVMEASSPSALQTAVKDESGNAGITQEDSEKLSLADYFAGVLNFGFLKSGSNSQVSTEDVSQFIFKYAIPVISAIACFVIAARIFKNDKASKRRSRG